MKFILGHQDKNVPVANYRDSIPRDLQADH
jgi:hypothetical protein